MGGIGSGTRVALRADYDAEQLRAIACAGDDMAQIRRLMMLAEIYDGATRAQAALVGGVTRQMVRSWVVRFNESGPEGLVARQTAPRTALNAEQRDVLREVVKRGYRPAAGKRMRRWRRVELVRWIWETFGISISPSTVGSEVRAMGYRRPPEPGPPGREPPAEPDV